MKVKLQNLNQFLNKYVKPATAFIGSSAISEPVIRLSANRKLTLECASQDRSIKIHMDTDIAQEGETFILAKSLSSLRSSHKEAVLSAEKGKLLIKSANKGRKLILNVDTVGEDGFISIDTPNIKTQTLGNFPLKDLKEVVNKLNINPVLVSGTSRPLISILPDSDTFKALVHDDLRVLLYESKTSKVDFDKRVVTDLRELYGIVNLIATICEKALFSFTKKAILVEGFNDSNEKLVDIKLQYALPGMEYIDRALGIAESSKKQKVVMGFICDNNFIEVLENVISLSNVRSSQGHIDVALKGKTITISGAGPSSTYFESFKVNKSMGKGTVRVGSNILSDITRLFSSKALFSVNKHSIIVTNKWKDKTVYFFLPFLTFSEKA